MEKVHRLFTETPKHRLLLYLFLVILVSSLLSNYIKSVGIEIVTFNIHAQPILLSTLIWIALASVYRYKKYSAAFPTASAWWRRQVHKGRAVMVSFFQALAFLVVLTIIWPSVFAFFSGFHISEGDFCPGAYVYEVCATRTDIAWTARRDGLFNLFTLGMGVGGCAYGADILRVCKPAGRVIRDERPDHVRDWNSTQPDVDWGDWEPQGF